MFLILRLESYGPKVTPVIGKVALDLLLKVIVNTIVIVKVLHGPKELGESVKSVCEFQSESQILSSVCFHEKVVDIVASYTVI